jgi:DNA-binding transcriptional ArsR family regulator
MSDRMTGLMEEQAELRWLWADPRRLVILMALRRAGGPLYAREMARQLGAHHETVSEKLHALRAMGMVTRPGVRSGWTLTASGLLFIQVDEAQGQNAPLPQEEPDEAELRRFLDSFCGDESAPDWAAPGEGEGGMGTRKARKEGERRERFQDAERSSKEIGDTGEGGWEDGAEYPTAGWEDEAENPTVGRNEGAEYPTVGREEGAEKPTVGRGDGADSGENPRLEAAKTLEEESINQEESINLLDSSSSSDLSDLEAEGENSISMTALLAASALLFGEPGVLRAHLPARPARLVLGWLAQSYVQRRNLRNPAGLVYRRLQRGDKPQPRYLAQPEKYLPRDYLAAIGWAGDAPVEAEEAGDPDEEETAEEEPVDASLLSEVNGRTVLWAWEQALRVLQGELSPGSTQAYLAEARPQEWDAAEGRLVVRAATPYARDWLQARMGKTLERMLCGILDREVRVVFEWEG